MIAVPAATHLLASYGANVIKVEDTVGGDALRFYGSTKNGMSAWFANANDGKRSIALNLKSEDGLACFKALVNDADVLVEGFRPQVMEKLGLGYGQLAELNPRLVYCSCSGFGHEGPYADRPVYDPLIQAMSGWASTQIVDNNPTLIRNMAADKVGAYNNAQAIMAALLEREREGHGSHVHTNMLDANLAFAWPDTAMHTSLRDPEGVEHRPNLLFSYRLYKASDGWVSVAIGTDKQWFAACRALDRPDIAEDERLQTTANRAADINLWYDTIDEMTQAFPTTEVITRLQQADVPCAPVLDSEAVFNDEHVQATGFLEEGDHPIIGRYRRPRPRSRQHDDLTALSPAPRWGEHSRELLLEYGFSAAQIESFIEEGAVRQG